MDNRVKAVVSLWVLGMCVMGNALGAVDVNSFLRGEVLNYGDSSSTVGEVWAGREDYEDYIKLVDIEIEREYSTTYEDYLIEISASLIAGGSTAPVWSGMFPGGVYASQNQRTIKVLREDGFGRTQEIPSQIGTATKCFRASDNSPGYPCSATNNRVSKLVIFVSEDLVTSVEDVSVVYIYEFGGASSPLPENYYRFEYNDTLNGYVQYNNTSTVDGRNAATYEPRILYDHPTEDVYILEDGSTVITYDRDGGDIVNVAYGGCSAGVTDYKFLNCESNDISKTLILGATPSQSLNVSVVLEIARYCDLMGDGVDTGSLVERITTNMLEQFVTVNSDSDEALEELYDARCSGTGFPGSVTFSSGDIDPYSRYQNTSFVVVDYVGGGYTEATNPNWAGGGMAAVGITKDGSGNCKYASAFLPVVFAVNDPSTTGDFELQDGRSSLSLGNPITIYGDSRVWSSSVVNETQQYDIFTAFVESTITTTLVCPFGPNEVTCTADADLLYSSTNSVLGILNAEPLGGRKAYSFLSYDFTGLCEDTYDYCYDMINLECVGSSLGYYDPCGEWHECLSCGGTCNVVERDVEYEVYFCGSSCIPTGGEDRIVESYCTPGTNVWNYTYACGSTVTTTCTYGCADNGRCADEAVGKYALFVGPASGWVDKGILGATVNITGTTDYGYPLSQSFVTTYNPDNFGNVAKFRLPKGAYNITSSANLYQTGCYAFSWIPQGALGYGGPLTGYQYCMLDINTLYTNEQGMSIQLLEEGISLNNTGVRVAAYNDVEYSISGVNVTIQVNNTYSVTGLTGEGGRVDLTFDSTFENPVSITGSKTGYETYTDSFNVVKNSRDNIKLMFMKPEGTIEIMGGGSDGLDNRVLGTALFDIGATVDVPVRFTKAGKVTLSRDRVRVRMCKPSFFDWIPFIGDVLGCLEFEDLKIACLTIPVTPTNQVAMNVTSGSKAGIRTITVENMRDLIKSPGTQCEFDTDLAGHIQPDSVTGMYKFTCIFTPYPLPEDDYVKAWKDNFGTVPFGGWMAQPIYNAAIGLKAVYDPFIQARITEYKALTGISSWGLQAIGEFLSWFDQDIVSQEVVFQCNMKEVFRMISDNKLYNVRISGETISGYSIDILTHPLYKPYVAYNQPPPVLTMNDYTSEMYSSDDQTLDFGLSEPSQYKKTVYVGEVKAGVNYIPLDRKSLIDDIHHDLLNHEEAGATFTLDGDPLPDARFLVEEYVTVIHEPEDGSPASVDYMLLPMYTANYTSVWIGPGLIIAVLVIIFVVGPLVIGYIKATGGKPFG